MQKYKEGQQVFVRAPPVDIAGMLRYSSEVLNYQQVDALVRYPVDVQILALAADPDLEDLSIAAGLTT